MGAYLSPARIDLGPWRRRVVDGGDNDEESSLERESFIFYLELKQEEEILEEHTCKIYHRTGLDIFLRVF